MTAHLQLLSHSNQLDAWEDIEVDEGPLEWDIMMEELDFKWEEGFQTKVDPKTQEQLFSSSQAPSHGQRVEDDLVRTEKHMEGGTRHGKGPDLFESFKEDENAHLRCANPYFPFLDNQDYGLGSWLSRLNIPMKEIDKFFKLDFVSAPAPNALRLCSK